MTLGFETILLFLRPIEHLIRDDSVSEIWLTARTAFSSNVLAALELDEIKNCTARGKGAEKQRDIVVKRKKEIEACGRATSLWGFVSAADSRISCSAALPKSELDRFFYSGATQIR